MNFISIKFHIGYLFLFLLTHNTVVAEISQQPQMCSTEASAIVQGKAIVRHDMAYIASFDSSAWNGHLRAVKNDGHATTVDQWDAAELIPSFVARNILTWNSQSKSGKEFVSVNLNELQKTALADDSTGSLLQYLRGDTSQERKNGGKYRTRKSPLGDIVNSTPLYIQDTDFGYRKISGLNGSASYRVFVDAKRSHAPYVYAGANDGMLHQFHAVTGIEGFAYVPAAVYPNLKSLSDLNYTHHYFVDGQITEGDAYLSGSWKNYLVGSTGAGAKSVFALDITNPDAMTATNVKWELGAGGEFADLGYVLGRVYVARSRSGDWMAVFGNGYDSLNKKAVLYAVNLSTGALIKKLEVKGDATRPNGLSTPAFLFNNQRELVTVYAGDLQGNLWKFDVSDIDQSLWKVAFDGKPLFTAKNATEVQPITTEPLIEFAPQGGYMVMFGTGKQFEEADRKSTRVESLYGIWDPDGISSAAITSPRDSVLIEQKLTTLPNGNRSLSKKPIDWKTKRGWYIDLDIIPGEQILSEPVLAGEVLMVTTAAANIRSSCDDSMSTQLLAINYKTGGAHGATLFGEKMASSIQILATVTSPMIRDAMKKEGVVRKQLKPGMFQPSESKEGEPTDGHDATAEGGYTIVINKRDGTGLQTFHIQRSGSPLVRTWRQLQVGY